MPDRSCSATLLKGLFRPRKLRLATIQERAEGKRTAIPASPIQRLQNKSPYVVDTPRQPPQIPAKPVALPTGETRRLRLAKLIAPTAHRFPVTKVGAWKIYLPTADIETVPTRTLPSPTPEKSNRAAFVFSSLHGRDITRH